MTPAEKVREWRRANPEKARATKQRWRLNNPDKVKAERERRNTVGRAERLNKNYLRRYGITLAERDAMLASQGGKCACCGTSSVGAVRGWHVDHCHTTKIVRGILCSGCNTFIGKIEADPARHMAALAYIERSK
jgi:hypothetical protein